MTIFLTFLHVLAAVSWIGGMVFLSAVVVPVLRQPSLASYRATLFAPLARQFRIVVWAAILLLLATGPLLVVARGHELLHPATWPAILRVKLTLVAVLLAISLLHDLMIGPRVAVIIRKAEPDRTPAERRLVRWAPLLARGNLLLGLAVLFAAVLLARS